MASPSFEEICARFGADAYAVQATGITIDDAHEHYAKCSLKIDSRHRNANGHVMGGVFFTLADFAFAIASNCGGNLTVTTTAGISYFTVPRGQELIAVCTLLRDGKNQCFYEVRITDEADTLIAAVHINGMHVNEGIIRRGAIQEESL